MPTLTVAARFCGPAASANGGYFAGLVATLAPQTVTVRLLKPPPLNTPFTVSELEGGGLSVLHGGEPIGEARPAVLQLQRLRGDGLRIFAGPLPEHGLVAAPWVPDSSLDAGDGKVRPEFMSAALDCPGYYAVAPDDRMLLLAEFTAHVDRRVHIGESCTLIGWQIAVEGRKHAAGTALFDGKGQLCGGARALWIAPRSASVSELPAR
jgi:hypothetical protein